jgi:hypothetical protein
MGAGLKGAELKGAEPKGAGLKGAEPRRPGLMRKTWILSSGNSSNNRRPERRKTLSKNSAKRIFEDFYCSMPHFQPFLNFERLIMTWVYSGFCIAIFLR